MATWATPPHLVEASGCWGEGSRLPKAEPICCRAPVVTTTQSHWRGSWPRPWKTKKQWVGSTGP